MSDLGTLTASLGIDTRGLSKGEKAFRDLEKSSMGRADKMSKSYSNAFKAIGVAAAAATAVVGVFFKKAEAQFSDFETALVDMGKVTDREFGKLRREVMALPANLGSASQLMKGYYAVISAGVEGTARQLDTLTSASKAAKAAHVDQALVIEGLTSIVDAYEGKVKDAAAAADLLFTIEKQGKTTVAQLIPYIGQLTSVSAELGIAQQELGASFAQITKFSGGTAEAATQYQAVLTSLMKPSEQMIKLFERFGGAQEAIKKIGYVNTLRRITGAYGGNLVVLNKLLGRKEAVLGFLALQKQGFAGVTKNIEDFNKSAGAMDKAWADYEKTWVSVKETFYNTIGKFAIQWIEELAPDMKEGLNKLSDWMTENQDAMVTGFKDMGEAAGVLAKVIGAISVAVVALPAGATAAAGGGLIGKALFGSWKPAKILAFAYAIEILVGIMNKVSGLNMKGPFEKLKEAAKDISNIIGEMGGDIAYSFEYWKDLIIGVSGDYDTLADKLGVVKPIIDATTVSMLEEHSAVVKAADAFGYYSVVAHEVDEALEEVLLENQAMLLAIEDHNRSVLSQVGIYQGLGVVLRLTGEVADATAKSLASIMKIIDEWAKVKNAYLMQNADYEIKMINKTFDEYAKVAKDKELVEAARAAALLKVYDKITEREMKSLNDAYEYSKRVTDREVADAIKRFEDEESFRQNSLEQQFNMTEAMYDDMKELYGRDYEFEAKLIEKKADLYKEAGIDAVKVAEWVSFKSRQQLKDQLIEYGGFIGGIASYLMEMQDLWSNSLKTVGEFGYSTFEKIGDAFEGSVVAVLKNDFDSIGDLWNALLDDLLDSFIKLIANLVKQWVMAGLANLVIGVTVGGATTGIGGSGGTSSIGGGAGGSGWASVLEYLGYGKSAYEGITGNSLIGQLWGLMGTAGYGTTTAAAMAAAMGGMGATTTTGAAGTAIGFSGIGAGGAAGSATGGMAAAIAAGPYLAAAIAAIMGAFAWQASSQNEPSSLITNWEGRASQDPEKLFEAELLNVSTYMGAWDEADILSTVNDVILSQVNEAFGTYNAIFRNVGEESQKKLKETFDGFEGLYLRISQMAAPGAPMSAMAGLGKYESWQANVWNDASDSYETPIDRTTNMKGWSSGIKGTALEAINEILGKFFEEFIAEAVEGLKGHNMFEFMTDDIQEAIEGADLDQFISDIKGFYESFTKNADLMQKAGEVWKDFNHWVEGTTEDYTQFDRIAMEAQVQVTAFAAKMAELGNELSEEEITDKLKEIFDTLSDGVDLEGLAIPMSLMDQLIAGINAQFDAYLEMLEKYGVDLEKINDLEEKRAEILERETKALSDATWEQVNATVDQLLKKTSPLEDTIIGVAKAFDNIFEALKGVLGIDDFTDEIAELQIELAALTAAFDKEVKAFTDMIGELELGDATAAIEYFNDELERLSKPIGGMGEFAVFFADMTLAFGSAAGDITGQFQFLYDALGGVKIGMQPVKDAGDAFQMAMRAFTGSMGGMTPDELIAGFGAIKDASEAYRTELEKLAKVEGWEDPTATTAWAKDALIWLNWFDTIISSFEATLLDLTTAGGSDKEIQRVTDILQALMRGGDLSDTALANALLYLNDAMDALIASGGASAEEIQRLNDEIARLEAATASYIDMQEKQLLAMKIAIGLIDEQIGKQMRLAELEGKYKPLELFEGLDDFVFTGFEDFVEQFKDMPLEDLKLIADYLDIDWTEIANDIAFLTGHFAELQATIKKITEAQWELLGTTEEEKLKAFKDRYGVDNELTADYAQNIIDNWANLTPEEVIAAAEHFGISVDEMIDDIFFLRDAFDIADEAVEDFAEKVKAIFAQIKEDIAISDWMQGGSNRTTADYWSSQIADMQARLGSETDPLVKGDLVTMSELVTKWYDAAVQVAQTWEQVADSIEGLISQVDNLINNIKYSTLNVGLPAQKFTEAEKDYDALKAAAETGGQAEIQEYLGFVQTYLQQAQNEFKSSEAYQQIYTDVMADLETVKGGLEAGGYDQKIYDELTTIDATLQARLTEINETFLGFESWINTALDDFDLFAHWVIEFEGLAPGEEPLLLKFLDLITQEGWTSPVTLHFAGQIEWGLFAPDEIIRVINTIATLEEWESEAVLKFLEDVDWGEFTGANVLDVIGKINDLEAWDSPATLKFAEGIEWGEIDSGMITFILNEIDTLEAWQSDAALEIVNGIEWGEVDPLWIKQYLENIAALDAWTPDLRLAFIHSIDWGQANRTYMELYLTNLLSSLEYDNQLTVDLVAALSDDGDITWPELRANLAIIYPDLEIKRTLKAAYLDSTAGSEFGTWRKFEIAWNAIGMPADSLKTLETIFDNEGAEGLQEWSKYAVAWDLDGMDPVTAEKTLSALYENSTEPGLVLWSDFTENFALGDFADAGAIKKIQAQYDADLDSYLPSWEILQNALLFEGIDTDKIATIKGEYVGLDMTFAELQGVLDATDLAEEQIRNINAAIVGAVETDVDIPQWQLLIDEIAGTNAAIALSTAEMALTTSEIAALATINNSMLATLILISESSAQIANLSASFLGFLPEISALLGGPGWDFVIQSDLRRQSINAGGEGAFTPEEYQTAIDEWIAKGVDWWVNSFDLPNNEGGGYDVVTMSDKLDLIEAALTATGGEFSSSDIVDALTGPGSVGSYLSVTNNYLYEIRSLLKALPNITAFASFLPEISALLGGPGWQAEWVPSGEEDYWQWIKGIELPTYKEGDTIPEGFEIGDLIPGGYDTPKVVDYLAQIAENTGLTVMALAHGDAHELSNIIAAYQDFILLNGWPDLPSQLPQAADGGAFSGPASGYPVELHGVEVVSTIPQLSQLINSGPTQSGASDRPINITLEIDGKALDVKIKSVSDRVRVTANKRPGNETRRLYR